MIHVRPATGDRWADVAAVMGTRGDPSRCWCQFFRLRGRDWHEATADANQAALQAQVCGRDLPPGVLGYAGEQPVGWCAVAPKSSYARLLSSPIAGPDVDGVWSVTCFVVRVGQRRKGVASALLKGAIELARAHQAVVIEGYPVDPSARSSVSSAELYHGPLPVFVKAGFVEVARPSPGRAVVRLQL